MLVDKKNAFIVQVSDFPFKFLFCIIIFCFPNCALSILASSLQDTLLRMADVSGKAVTCQRDNRWIGRIIFFSIVKYIVKALFKTHLYNFITRFTDKCA